jgi:hypothetical protein
MHASMFIGIYANRNKVSLGSTYQKCSGWPEGIVVISPVFAECYKLQSFTYSILYSNPSSLLFC